MGTVLAVNNSETSRGVGIQADLQTIASLACHDTSTITAITSQSSDGEAIYPIPHGVIAEQINSILTHAPPYAVKVGLLYDIDCVRTVVRALTSRKANSPTIICNPVCVLTSGRTLLDTQATRALVEELFPLTRVIVPNKSNAKHLLVHRGLSPTISRVEDMISAAKNLLQCGSQAVVLTGDDIVLKQEDIARLGHDHPEVGVISVNHPTDNMEILRVHAGALDTRRAVNILCDAGQTTLFIAPHVDSQYDDQIGSTIATAVACYLASGFELKEAVRHAVMYAHLAISSPIISSQSHRVINYFHASVQRIVPQVTPTNRFPFTQRLIEGDAAQWKAYVEHDFVKQLGQGTLDRKAFEHFIKQDYKYLTYYSRAQALLAAKSTSFQDIRDAIKPITNVLKEIETHKAFAASFEITEADLENEPEAVTTTAYGAYLIDIGTQGDTTKLLMALLACLLGYGEVGLWLKKEAAHPNSWVVTDQNPYKRWMDDMAGEMYQTAVRVGLDLIESRAAADPPSPARYAEWEEVWRNCTRFEKGFWDAAMAAARAQ